MWEIWVWSLIWENPTCHRAAKLVPYNYWTCALETVPRNCWAQELQLLKPMHLELVLCSKKSHCSEKLENSPCFLQLKVWWTLQTLDLLQDVNLLYERNLKEKLFRSHKLWWAKKKHSCHCYKQRDPISLLPAGLQAGLLTWPLPVPLQIWENC